MSPLLPALICKDLLALRRTLPSLVVMGLLGTDVALALGQLELLAPLLMAQHAGGFALVSAYQDEQHHSYRFLCSSSAWPCWPAACPSSSTAIPAR